MTCTPRAWAAIVAALVLAAAPPGATAQARAAKPVPPELPAETLTSDATLAGATTERVYVADVMISNIADGRLRVFDVRAGRLLGLLNTGYAGNFVLSAKSDEVYVATTYLSRGGRGDRSDILEVWDAQTLAFKHEVLLPPKRAQTLNYRGMVSLTGDGRYALVQNATPATSVTVVDLAGRKVATEVPTPGCWATWPAASGARFSMLCGDGKVATVTLDGRGQVADRQLSDKLFDADQDAWFSTAERIGDRHYFLSFKGTITELDLSGPVARVVGSRAITGSREDAKRGWRPGGYQAFAVHPDGRHAVVAMHAGGREGTHKMPARQLWVVDLASGRKVASHPGVNTVSLAFSKSGRRLQALDGVASALHTWDWLDGGKLKKVSTIKPAGQASVQLESHD